MSDDVVKTLAVVAAKLAGRWLKRQVAEATDEALAMAAKMADTVDRAARSVVRGGQAAIVDTLSVPVAKASQAYQAIKAPIVAGAEAVGRTMDKVKKWFGAQEERVVAPCPFKEVPDGALMLPSEACPGDNVPIPEGEEGVMEAMKQAKAADVRSTSKCCAGRPAADREKTLVYVNGVNTSPEAHCKTLKMLRDMTCGRVIGVMNASEGILTDAVRTADARDMIRNEIGGDGKPRTYSGFTPAVKTMQDVMMVQALSGEQTEIYAHSEGAAITSLAAIRAKSELASMGEVGAIGKLGITSMGGAAPAWPDGPKYRHYVHEQDVVPNTLGLGDAAKRPGEGAQVVRFGGRNGKFKDVGPGDKKAYGTFTPGWDPLADHYADTSYLPYIDQKLKQGGESCLGKE